jgi:hypothetical protein
VADLPGGVVAAVHVALLEHGPVDMSSLARHFNHSEIVTACELGNGRFRVYSDWSGPFFFSFFSSQLKGGGRSLSQQLLR